jgi:hypothetical protein
MEITESQFEGMCKTASFNAQSKSHSRNRIDFLKELNEFVREHFNLPQRMFNKQGNYGEVGELYQSNTLTFIKNADFDAEAIIKRYLNAL